MICTKRPYLLSCLFVIGKIMKNRLSKILAQAGICSRRAAEELIFSKRVSVDGTVITRPEHHVDIAQEITVDGQRIQKPKRSLYVMLHKPKGYVCTRMAKNPQKIIFDLLPFKERLFCVGRLDKETEGLLLLTTDGQFANQIMHPRYQIEKEYHARVKQPLSSLDLHRLGKRIYVEKCVVRPKKIMKINRHLVSMTLTEGKKHEVRQMVRYAGLDLVHLKRIRIGHLRLKNLPVGAYRFLTSYDKKSLQIDFIS
jgi:23S rRNA pseudouridine2605 synthase